MAQLGIRDGAEESSFFRIAGAVRLSDGKLLVLNGGTMQLRYFLTSGEFLFQSGGRGGGPGEFQRFSSLQTLPSDSVLVYDRGQSRVSVFDMKGTLASVTPITVWAGNAPGDLIGRFPDGSFAMRHTSDLAPVETATVHRETDAIVRYSAIGRLMDTVATFPGVELVAVHRGGGRFQFMPAPFGRRRHYLLRGAEIVSAENDRYEFVFQDTAGIIRQIVRLQREAQPVTTEDREGIPPELYPGIRIPGRRPAIARMLTDEVGNLWVERYRSLSDGADSHWEVIDRHGRWLTTVVVPGGLEITQIGIDYLLGTVRDSMDVEYVRLHTLVKRD